MGNQKMMLSIRPLVLPFTVKLGELCLCKQSNFQLDVGSFTLTSVATLKFQIKIPIFKGKFSKIFRISVRLIFQIKAQMTFFVSHSLLMMLRFPKLNLRIHRNLQLVTSFEIPN